MIPKKPEAYLKAEANTFLASKTFELNPHTHTIGSCVSGLDAMRQAVYLMLSTERYRHLIYSWDYGLELADLIGANRDEVTSVIEQRIRETLLQDLRIEAVTDFKIETQGAQVTAIFVVRTLYGDFTTEKVVTPHV